MPKEEKEQRRRVNRRDFLALAAAGATLAATDATAKLPPAKPGRHAAEIGATQLDTGGIALEHFEAARKRAASIVAKLTLPEKISMFGTRTPAVPRLKIPAFNFYSSEALHGLIHGGPITSFPLPLAMGCSWNRPLIREVFTAVSDEIWAWHKKGGQGLAVFSPPTVNMGTRDPRWGRIGENYSEDPYLVGQMAIYTIHGMQGDNPRFLKTIACAKHFICNDTEDDREETSATVDPRSFWEYYSRGFEACVREGHVFTVMSSYNAMNGIPTTANRALLTALLRERWGFRGYVVSDCDAVGDITRTHHFVPTYPEAAALAVNAGCDINCGNTLAQNLGAAVNQMLVSESTLDHSLIRSYTGRVLLGDFDPIEQSPYSKTPISCLESPAHRELAREMGRQSIVLFKNENNALPLDKTGLDKIAVIGPMAAVCHLGNYSGTPWNRISPLEGIRQHLGIMPGPSYKKSAGDFSELGSTAAARGGFFSSGPRLMNTDEGNEALSFFGSGAWASFKDVLLTGADKIHASVASGPLRFGFMRQAPNATGGGSLEVRLDSATGPVVATIQVPDTGNLQKWVNVEAPLTSTSGTHTLYVVSSAKRGSLVGIESFSLTPEAAAPTPSAAASKLSYAIGCTVTGEKNGKLFNEAIQAAKEAEVVLLFVGADQQVDREGHDRDYIHLPGAQHELAQAVFAANPKTVLVISSNCPVAVNWEQENLPAIVGGMFLGGQQGLALADVLFGDYNPGGKLNTTWFRDVKDLPDFHDYDVRHGRTYMYYKGQPLYPFGHGLSYTTFEYDRLALSAKTLRPGGRIAMSFKITNSGKRDGDEIVQAYVHVNTAGVVRPEKQLVNFERVHLKAGETRTLTLELPHDHLALRYWDEKKNEFAADSGAVDIMIGASSADIKLKDQFQIVA